MAAAGWAAEQQQEQPAQPAAAQEREEQPRQREEKPELRAERLRFHLAAARAVALFQSADSVAANLEARGDRLHGDLVNGRRAIERALDKAEAALDKGDHAAAGRATRQAEGALKRYARSFGAGS